MKRLAIGSVVLALGVATARAGGPSEGPTSAELAQARGVAAAFRRADGIPRAVRALCGREDDAEIAHAVASVVLVERGARGIPGLLDAIAADRDGVGTACGVETTEIAVEAVCDGRAAFDRFELDRRSEQVVARARAAAERALLEALAKPGRRQGAALAVLSAATFWRAPNVGCGVDRAGLVRRATSAVVRLLALPSTRDDALRVLASGGADPALAVPALKPLLVGETLPLAALALARLGADVSAAVGPLAAALTRADQPVVVEALRLIGPPARGALPALAALARRVDAACGQPVASGDLVAAIAAIAVDPGDAGVALTGLEPLLRCTAAAAAALARLGGDGRRVLLAGLRDEGATIYARRELGEALRRAGTLEAADQATLDRIADKLRRQERPQMQVAPPPPPPRAEVAAAELTACRAEAGLPPVSLPALPDADAGRLAACLAQHLCGPSRAVLAATLGRCCQPFGGHAPAVCVP